MQYGKQKSDSYGKLRKGQGIFCKSSKVEEILSKVEGGRNFGDFGGNVQQSEELKCKKWSDRLRFGVNKLTRVDPEENHPSFTQKSQNALYSTNLIIFLCNLYNFISVSMIRLSTYNR